MRAKVTMTVPRWSEAAWVAEKTRIRDRYGDAIADAVEMVAHMVKDRRDRPSARDIKRTLLEIVEKPATVNLRRVDGYTETMLVTAALRQYQTTDLRKLTPEQLADCARLALQRRGRGSGRSETDDLALLLVKALLHAAPATIGTVERGVMLSDALTACGLGSGEKTVERLLTKAG